MAKWIDFLAVERQAEEEESAKTKWFMNAELVETEADLGGRSIPTNSMNRQPELMSPPYLKSHAPISDTWQNLIKKEAKS